jgi:hypothetical protein
MAGMYMYWILVVTHIGTVEIGIDVTAAQRVTVRSSTEHSSAKRNYQYRQSAHRTVVELSGGKVS